MTAYKQTYPSITRAKIIDYTSGDVVAIAAMYNESFSVGRMVEYTPVDGKCVPRKHCSMCAKAPCERVIR
jgi:hypothetical protein